MKIVIAGVTDGKTATPWAAGDTGAAVKTDAAGRTDAGVQMEAAAPEASRIGIVTSGRASSRAATSGRANSRAATSGPRAAAA